MIAAPRRILALSALAMAPLASTISAQLVEFDPDPKSLRWAVPPTDSFNRTAVGDIDGDLLPDICFLDGNELRFVFGPALFGALMEPRPEAVDIGVWPDYESGRDAAVTVGSQGARVHSWNPSTKLWTNTKISQHADWEGATVVAVRVPSTGSPEVFGVVRSGLYLRALRGGDDDELMPSDVPLIDLEFADLDGDGVRELACVGDDRMHILKITGVDAAGKDIWTYQGTHFALNFLSVGARRGRQVNETKEWLSWLGTWPYVTPPEQWLTLVREPAVSTPLLIANDPDIVGFAVGDWAGDGSQDLVQSWTKTKKLGVLVNQSTGDPPFTYSGQGSLELDYGAPNPQNPAPNNRSWPALTDGDGDADDDLFFLVQSTGKLHVGFNGKVDEGLFNPEQGGGGPLIEEAAEANCVITLETLGSGTELLEFDVIPPAGLPSDVNALEIILFRLPHGASTTFVPAGPLISQAHCYARESFTAGPVTVSFDCDLEEGFVDDGLGLGKYLPSMYFWILRYVVTDATGVIKVYPAKVFGLQVKGDPGTGDQDAVDCEQLLLDYGADPTPYYVYDEDDLYGPSVITVLGTAYAIPCLPLLACDDPPGWELE